MLDLFVKFQCLMNPRLARERQLYLLYDEYPFYYIYSKYYFLNINYIMSKIKKQKKIERKQLKLAKLLLKEYNDELSKYDDTENIPKFVYNAKLDTFICE